MTNGLISEIITIASRQGGIVSAKDVESVHIARTYLSRMCKRGLLQRIGHGLYTLPDPDPTENQSVVEVIKQVPKAIICLISALSFHEITTQIPHQVSIAIPRGAWRPTLAHPPLDITWVSEPAFSFGTQTHILQGVPVRIYTPAKTIADCFKFRNKVGLDVALEALKEARRQRKIRVDEILEAAAICGVSKVIRPYLEAIL